VVSARAVNVIARTDGPQALAPDVRVAELVSAYEQRVRPLARRPVGRLGAPFAARTDEQGLNPATLLVADAQLAATREAGAEVAFMNATGVRAALGESDRLDVVYEDVFSVQPFGNQLITVTLTGAQLLQLLERPLASGTRPRPGLLHSKGLVYTWDTSRPAGQRIVPGSLQLNGKPVTPEQRVRVTANDFLVDSDGSIFGKGSDRQAGPVDVEALEQYIRSHPGLVPDTAPRVTRLN
jgi:5'-nucleotidase